MYFRGKWHTEIVLAWFMITEKRRIFNYKQIRIKLGKMLLENEEFLRLEKLIKQLEASCVGDDGMYTFARASFVDTRVVRLVSSLTILIFQASMMHGRGHSFSKFFL